jgi:hypothetical protein
MRMATMEDIRSRDVLVTSRCNIWPRRILSGQDDCDDGEMNRRHNANLARQINLMILELSSSKHVRLTFLQWDSWFETVVVQRGKCERPKLMK